MNHPWDVAVAKDGSIFVVDTFNHRIQKFSPTGRFIKMIGIFAQGNAADTLWGPRAIAISNDGKVFVVDTGNKRIVVYDQDLNLISQFGGAGFEPGQFDEPVGIAISNAGNVAVADTWNRRVQIFSQGIDGISFTPIGEFDVDAWFGQSLDNKPFIAYASDNTLWISDPEGDRLLNFNEDGELIRVWNNLSISSELLSRPYGIDFDSDGNLWVSDAAMNIIERFDTQP
jgi:DNA-binding beta-propeller fold protein YncE